MPNNSIAVKLSLNNINEYNAAITGCVSTNTEDRDALTLPKQKLISPCPIIWEHNAVPNNGYSSLKVFGIIKPSLKHIIEKIVTAVLKEQMNIIVIALTLSLALYTINKKEA